MSMTQDRLLIIGVKGDDHKWVLDNLVDRLEAAGFENIKQFHYPKVSLADARAALLDEDLSRKNASWIRDVPERKLRPILDAVNDPRIAIWGFSVTLPADWNTLTTVIDDLPEMETTEIMVLSPTEADPRQAPDMEFQPRPPKNPNAPFSYDPAQDYYTEPDY